MLLKQVVMKNKDLEKTKDLYVKAVDFAKEQKRRSNQDKILLNQLR